VRVAHHTLARTVTPALSQTLEFKPVPDESVNVLERRRERRDRRVRVEAAPEAPEPAEPGEPTPPEPPRTSRSGDVMKIATDIHVEEDEVVEGDVVAVGGDIQVDGHVEGNVVATGGDVSLGSTARVDGDVMCMGGKLTEEPGAWVGGQRVTALTREERRREIKERIKEKIEEKMNHREDKVAGALVSLLFGLLAAWAATKIAPTRTATALQTLQRDPGTSFLWGLLGIMAVCFSPIALAVVIVLLVITLIGILLVPVVALAYVGMLLPLILFLIWGSVVGAMPLGLAVAARTGGTPPRLMRTAVYGALVLNGARFIAELIHMMPFIGWIGSLLWVLWLLACIILTMTGVGALLRSKFGQGPEGQWWPFYKRTPPLAPAGAAGGPVPPPPSWPAPEAPAPSTSSFTPPPPPSPPSSFAPPPPPPPEPQGPTPA
jgi:cytoskeletal protein CcmA (bactofilin family)